MNTLTKNQYDALADIVMTGVLAIYGLSAVINLAVYGLHYIINLKF